jgi:hypothetical protein
LLKKVCRSVESELLELAAPLAPVVPLEVVVVAAVAVVEPVAEVDASLFATKLVSD